MTGHRPFSELSDDLRRRLADRESITCPRCGRTSHNQNDVANGYCGACHEWTEEADLGGTATCPDCGNPLRFCDCPDGDLELPADESEPSHHVPDAEVGRDEPVGIPLRGSARPVQPAGGPPDTVRPEGVEREALEGQHAR